MWNKILRNSNYSISENGDVRNDITGKMLVCYFNKKTGYKSIDLWKDGKPIKCTIHRLLAETFISNPENKPCIDHKDGNKLNNNLSNLRWATYSENNSRFGTIGVRSQSIIVRRFSADGVMTEEKTFARILDSAKYFGVSISSVSQMLKSGTVGKRGKTKHYQFVYKNSERVTTTENARKRK